MTARELEVRPNVAEKEAARGRRGVEQRARLDPPPLTGRPSGHKMAEPARPLARPIRRLGHDRDPEDEPTQMWGRPAQVAVPRPEYEEACQQ